MRRPLRTILVVFTIRCWSSSSFTSSRPGPDCFLQSDRTNYYIFSHVGTLIGDLCHQVILGLLCADDSSRILQQSKTLFIQLIVHCNTSIKNSI